MKTNLCVLIVFLSICSSAWGETISPDELLPCGKPACDLVAKKIEPINLPPINNGLAIDVENWLRVTIPVPERIIPDSHAVTAIYPGKKAIVIETQTIPEDLRVAARTLTDNQFPEIIFLKTTKDQEPESPADKTIWRAGLIMKDADLSIGLNNARYFSNDDLTVYFSTHTKVFSGSAHITDVTHKSGFLRISAVNIEESVFKQIIANVAVIVPKHSRK
ncbi:MAG: hypothetical protein HY080_05365 [Gammaproteobacteria bacterium]|nr:hypothetical protein [Gammaproteobacteria bacterium]